LLALEGCTNYQGYLYGKPLPVDEFERFTQTMMSDYHPDYFPEE
jgi:EAL domain-containing protein (putative c-di-GMP-specific phosphodiesterase class I)